MLGALALEGAALAIADVSAVGARGEDWTGFVLLPVGVALLGALGDVALALAQARPAPLPASSRDRRRSRVAAYWLVVPVTIAILATHRPRAEVAPADLGRAYAEVTIPTSDGLDLAAWYVPSQNGAAVVSYPTRQGKLPQARMLVRHGYGVLLLNARGYDGSEGDPNMFGWDGARTSTRRSPGCSDGRTSGMGGSAASASRSGRDDDPGSCLQSRSPCGRLGGRRRRSVREELLYGWRGWLALPQAAVGTAAVAILSGTAPPPSLTE